MPACRNSPAEAEEHRVDPGSQDLACATRLGAAPRSIQSAFRRAALSPRGKAHGSMQVRHLYSKFHDLLRAPVRSLLTIDAPRQRCIDLPRTRLGDPGCPCSPRQRCVSADVVQSMFSKTSTHSEQSRRFRARTEARHSPRRIERFTALDPLRRPPSMITRALSSREAPARLPTTSSMVIRGCVPSRRAVASRLSPTPAHPRVCRVEPCGLDHPVRAPRETSRAAAG